MVDLSIGYSLLGGAYILYAVLLVLDRNVKSARVRLRLVRLSERIHIVIGVCCWLLAAMYLSHHLESRADAYGHGTTVQTVAKLS